MRLSAILVLAALTSGVLALLVREVGNRNLLDEDPAEAEAGWVGLWAFDSALGIAAAVLFVVSLVARIAGH